MDSFTTQTKKWGNSLGIIIPKDVARGQGIREHDQLRVLILPKEPLGMRLWGEAHTKKPTKEILEEVNADFEPHTLR